MKTKSEKQINKTNEILAGLPGWQKNEDGLAVCQPVTYPGEQTPLEIANEQLEEWKTLAETNRERANDWEGKYGEQRTLVHKLANQLAVSQHENRKLLTRLDNLKKGKV